MSNMHTYFLIIVASTKISPKLLVDAGRLLQDMLESGYFASAIRLELPKHENE